MTEAKKPARQLGADAEDTYNRGNAAAQKLLDEHQAVSAGLTEDEAKKASKDPEKRPVAFAKPDYAQDNSAREDAKKTVEDAKKEQDKALKEYQKQQES